MTKKCNRLRGERPKAFWGALVGGAMNLIGSAISSKSQARAIRRQIEAQKEAARTQLELANNSNLASTLNSYATATRSYNDEDDYNLKYRLGGNKRLGSNRIYITDGGNATKIGNDTYLLRGGSHEQTNETGQTGIGINVGGNEIEAEGGEVAQKKNGALRIFSAQPMLGGISPAQAVMSGANKDKVFSAQQRFKRRNHLSDGGGRAKWGIGWLDSLFGNGTPKKKTVHFYKSQATGKVFKTRQEAIAENNKYKTDLGYRRNINREREVEAAIRKQGNERIPYIKEKEIKLTNAGKLTGARLSTNQLDSIAKYANRAGLPIKTALGLVGQESAFGNYFGYANNAKDLNTYNTQPKEVRDKYGIPAYKIVNYENLIPERTPTNVDDFAINKRYGKRSVTGFGFPTITNGEELDRLKIQHEAYPALQRKRSKFWRDINTPTLQLAFEHYKTSPQTYNAGNPNQQNLVNSKANDVWGSPEIQKWYRTSPYAKHRLGGRCKLRGGDEVPYNHYDPTGLFGGDPHPLAKMVDVTGITSWGDVKKLIDKKKKGEIPTTQEYLSALSAIPAIGRIPKIINTIGNIADATTFMEDVRRSEAKEEAYQNEIVKYYDIHGRLKTGRRGSMPYGAHELRKRLGGRMLLRNGGLTSKDRGSSKHPYPSVSSKDFAGGGRSYPIPTKADAIDALRLAGLHGRSDVKAKVYSRYPELRKKAEMGTWVKPVYNTSKYHGTSRARKQIAKWEGSDFAGQNAQFKGDAIGAKERELRQFMGKAYNYLNDNQRDALLSYYYNVVPKSFRGQMTKYRNALINAQTEQEYNDTLNNMRESINIGANRKGMSGLRNRRAIERNWFGYTTPMNTNQTRAILKQQDDAKLVQPTDNTRVVIQPQYIEVPALVGHGIVPVDNPDPNLLQGNIKDNLINMGNKFRLGQRCGGSTRVRKSLGGESRPVKGMRRKLTWGDVTYPYRRNNNFDYWDIIDQEQKANDKGGISPWTTSNNYDVKVPYAITKSTPTIPYTSKVSTPTSGVSENKTIPTYIGNKSGMIIRDADWYGLGADLVSSIGGSILGLGAYKNLDFDYNLPNFVEESPVALNTTYHNEAQKSNVERNRLNSRNSILRNTMSGSTAIGRMQGVDTNALYQLNQLADEKTNKETELMNQNLLNEQQVRARNAAAKNQYYNTVASIKNAAIQAKNEAELAKGQILSGSLQGIGNSFQNFISQGRQNYDDTQAMLMGVAASDYATPSRLLELGVDVGDDAALAGIYRSAMNVPNPGARPKREDYSDNTEYSYALTRWENQNKAYQRRNSYADLIKGRMSKKNLIKYGII